MLREEITLVFREYLLVPLFEGFVPESVTSLPRAAYNIDDEKEERSLDGEVTGQSVLFSIDLETSGVDQLDEITEKLLRLSGYPNHRFREHFQLLTVESKQDAGQTQDTNDGNNNSKVSTMRILLIK